MTSHALTLESVAHSTVRLVSPHTAKGSTMAVSTSPRFSLSSDSVETLRRRISGSVLLKNEAGFDAARTIWNAMIDRSPTLIVQPERTADVVAAVRFAADQDLPIAVRGGGHNVAGLAICDDGLMIDLSRMRRVDVDPEWKTARAQGGATWWIRRATAAHAGHDRRRDLDHRDCRPDPRRRTRQPDAPSAWPATTCSPATSSPPTAMSSRPARPRTRTSSGACAAAAATSASSPCSSTGSTRSARSSVVS